MNIFVLDKDPIKAAELHGDPHTSKMILESAQMICTALHVVDSNIDKEEIPYAEAYTNHPCTKWVRESKENFDWLVSMSLRLEIVRQERTGKFHKSGEVIRQCSLLVINSNFYDQLPSKGLTPFALAMPDEYQSDDAVKSYQNYYIHEKFLKEKIHYKDRPIPDFIQSYLDEYYIGVELQIAKS